MAKNLNMSNYMPGRPPTVMQLVKPYLVQKALSNSRRYNIFHPSAWGSCLRKVAYQFYNEQDRFLQRSADDVDTRLELVFDNGHKTHFRWQEYLTNAGVMRGYWRCAQCGVVYGKDEKMGIKSPLQADSSWKCQCGHQSLEYEETTVQSEPQYNFKGHVDAIVDLRDTPWAQNNEYDVFVVDFKTIKDDMFSELTQAKYEHVVQTNIYMWILGLKLAVVLYENKDNQTVKEMLVPRDDALIEGIKKEALWMVDVLRHGKLPARPSGFSRSGFPCRFCEFRDLCYA